MMQSLDIDAGNTRIKWRLRENDFVSARGDTLCENFSTEQLAQQIGSVPGEVNLSSVSQPAIIESIRKLCHQWGSNLFVARTSTCQAGVTCGYVDHRALGVDRWLAILAAYNRAKGACIVMDAGSAITLDMVDAGGIHLGGYIVPGYRMLCQALSAGTEQVRPEYPVGVSIAPGRSTSEAVNHGIMGMIKGLVDGVLVSPDLRKHSVSHFLTGGDAQLITKLLSPDWKIVPDLVLEGLSLARKDVGYADNV